MMSFFWIFSVAFALFALYLLGIGIRGIVTKRPFVLPARQMFWLLALCLIPSAILSLSTLFDSVSLDGEYLTLFPALSNTLILVLMWKQLSGYMAFGVTDESFRAALHAALKQLNLPFEESLSRLHLPSLNTDVQATVQGWTGVGQLRFKQRQHADIGKDVARAMNEYFTTTARSINQTVCVFYTVFGVMSLIFAVYFGVITSRG
jgi:hypothetical protein